MKKIHVIVCLMQMINLHAALPVTAKEAQEVTVKLPAEKILRERLSALSGGVADFIAKKNIPHVLAENSYTIATLKEILESNIDEYVQQKNHVPSLQAAIKNNLRPILECILQDHATVIASLEK